MWMMMFKTRSTSDMPSFTSPQAHSRRLSNQPSPNLPHRTPPSQHPILNLTLVISFSSPSCIRTDDGETPKAAPAPKPTTSTPAAAPKAREVPGSKPPASGNKGGDNATRGKSGYYSRGGPRNVLKNNVKPAGEGETITVDPEEGYEGERRGQSSMRRETIRFEGNLWN
jgi:hypothetical protein